MREYERVEAARAEAIAEIRKEKGDPDAIVSEEDLEKLGLQKPEPRQLGHAYVPVNRQYRYPEPAVAPGRAADPQAQRRAQQINGHNAILEVVNGNWQAYLAEVARIRQGVMQGLQFAGGGAREDAARVYADYWRTVLAGTGREDALPQPVLVPARQAQVPVVVPPVPQPVIIPAVPQIAPQPFVPAAARARRRVRGGPA